MEKVSASVVIPSWNGQKFLRTCLNSLKRQTLKNFEVIIVDNGSTDNSLEYLRRYFPDYRVIALDKNYGFARAVNEGIKASKSDKIILLNNDTESDPKYLEYLVKASLKHPQVGFIAAKMINFYDRSRIDSAGDALDVVGHSYNIGLGQKDDGSFDEEGECFMATGGGSLFRKKMFNKVGLFDEDFFTYMEDVDLCLRAQLRGFKGWYEPRAICYHIRKGTSSRIISKTEYWHFRNLMQNIIKNYPKGLLLHQFNWLRILLVNLNTVKYMAFKGYLKQALLAELWILTNLPMLLGKRRAIQSSKAVTDQYIIDHILPKRITFYGLLDPGV